MFVSGKVAAKEIGVSADTLRRWANKGLVRVQRISGVGKRFYHTDDVKRMFTTNGNDIGADAPKEKAVYARVSSKKQQEDLQRQIDALQSLYPGYTIVSDIASGLNWKRRGLRALLERALNGLVAEVVVMHKDRLCRFGFELLEFVLSKVGTKLLVHGEGIEDHKSSEQELAEDLLGIITVFTARHHGKRNYGGKGRSRKRKRSDNSDPEPENSVLSDSKTSADAESVVRNESVGVEQVC